MPIVLDGMGSDRHPLPEIQAAVQAASESGNEILIVGDREVLSPVLEEHNKANAPVSIVHAPEVFKIAGKLSGSALRREKNSIGIAMDLVKTGKAAALVSAGDTGGVLAIGLARLGRIKGVRRPALSALFPVVNGYCVIADIGANVECKPEHLLQFAIMGSVYAEKMLDKVNPRVGLLSIGEEAGKGNNLVKATYPLLESSKLNFIGNVEGKEIMSGKVDVVTMDGFSGNIFVKTSEAVAKMLIDNLKESLMASPITKFGALLAKPAFANLKEKLDPEAIGAVPLLGLNGLVFKAHGRSSARALVNALRLAQHAVSVDLMGSMHAAIEARIHSHRSMETN